MDSWQGSGCTHNRMQLGIGKGFLHKIQKTFNQSKKLIILTTLNLELPFLKKYLTLRK